MSKPRFMVASMPDDFRQLRSHMTSLEPAPKRKPSENQMGVHYGTCCHWNAEARFGFIAMDAPIVEVADRDLYVGWRSLQRSGSPRSSLLMPA
jgi:hypothetical protein